MSLSNYPDGVDDSHPHFNPPVCSNCGEEVSGDPDEPCPGCSETRLTPEDIEDIRADAEFDRLRDEGRL